ncbi:MAG: phage integrase family site-specific recombinase [Nocardioides sp.]|nr:phage integrase family site-specific recombinase [Nocardioides sp.]
MARRGVPFHPDAETAFEMAKSRIATYKGTQPVFTDEMRLLVQTIVLDALVIAPQPVARGWVNTSLMAVGGLVRWAMFNAEPLNREHLLSQSTRNRFLNLGTNDLLDTSRRNYRCRLDLIATALTTGPVEPTITRPLVSGEATDPHTPGEIATLWVWAQGLRPATRRDRTLGILVLGLGCGLRSAEQGAITPESVVRDEHGVHVTVVADRGVRVVTCDRVWEDRLLTLVENAEPGRPLISPWRTEPTTARALQTALAYTEHAHPPLAWFSVRSLRNTWLTQRLAEGVPVPMLLDAAGLESIEALKAFLVYLPTVTAAERATWLRGRGVAIEPVRSAYDDTEDDAFVGEFVDGDL